jgi:leucyl-tRNA synthetase
LKVDPIQYIPATGMQERKMVSVGTAHSESSRYFFSEIEPKWQERWEAAALFHSEPSEDRPNCVVIELPPFANGSLHLGHVRNYALGDVCARFRRMAGFNVLYTSGFDSFGLPNELAAAELGRHPKEVAEDVMAEMRRDFVRLGLSHDTRRIIGNHDESFYGWVQWVFLKLLEQDLAYRQRYPVLWCPKCATTLADSLAEGGRCWRCGTFVETRALEQWLVREAVFADDMIASLSRLDRWPARIKQIHTDWIGRREGVEVKLPVAGSPAISIAAFVAQPESLHRFARVGLAAEHPVLAALRAAGLLSTETLEALVCLPRSTRSDEQVSLGVNVVHPLTGEKVPVSVDKNLDLRTHDGVAVFFRPGDVSQDTASVIATLHVRETGTPAVRYRLRDWNIARQRYWGPPVPVIHCSRCGAVPVPEKDLPVLLPLDIDLNCTGNPLEHHRMFTDARCPKCSGAARRDTDTLETYCSPWWYHWNAKRMNTTDPFDKSEARLYMPVDVMIGGEDQARTCFFHLRMIARALRHAGVVELDEPIDTLIAIGMVKSDGRKMSKSEGNTVDPRDLVARYGTDALRFAILGAAAPDSAFNWSEDLVRRAYSFMNRVWIWCERLRPDVRLDSIAPGAGIDESYSLTRKLERHLDTAVTRTTEAMARNLFHLAAANLKLLLDRIEEYEKEAHKRRKDLLDGRDRQALAIAASAFLRMLTPLCPHIAEECWCILGGSGMIACAAWPTEFPADFKKGEQRHGIASIEKNC